MPLVEVRIIHGEKMSDKPELVSVGGVMTEQNRHAYCQARHLPE